MRRLALLVLWLACGNARAEPAPEEGAEVPWCAPELETLPGEVCFHAGKARDDRRTAVIFLHGLVQRGADWQHAQQRGIVRGAQRLGFAVFAPRGRPRQTKTVEMVAWPTSGAAQRAHEAEIVAEWKAAIDVVEKRDGKPFDEVFVVGFSNGAYYGASLALRGAAPVDGYAVFAGGAGAGPPSAAERAPVFVGIAGKDATAADSRALVRTLKKHGWPHRAEARAVGHMIADRHLDSGIAYLREQVDERH